MSNTFTSLIGLNTIGTGNDIDTWGDIEANNKLITEQAIKGVLALSVSGNYALRYTTDATDQSHFAILDITDGTGGVVYVQPVQGQFFVHNGASGDVVFQSTGTATAILHPGDCTYIFNDGAGSVRQIGSKGVGVADQISSALANARAYTDSTSFAMDSGQFPAQPDYVGGYLHTDGNSAMWRLVTSSDIVDLANVTVAKDGDTMTGALGFANTTAQIGHAIPAGLSLGMSNVAVRALSNTGVIALQSYAGANTFATVSAAGADFQVPLTNYGNAVWTTGTLTPSDYQPVLGFAPANKAGDIFSGGVSINYAANATSYDAGGMLTLTNEGLSGSEQRTVALGTSPSGNGYVRAPHQSLDLVAGDTLVATFGPSITLASRPSWNGATPWDSSNFNPQALQSGLGYTPVNKAGDTLSGNLYFSSAGSMGIGNGPASGVYGDGTNIAIRGFNSSASPILLQSYGGAATYATVTGTYANFNVQLQQGGAAVWTTANLTPSQYAPLDGADLTNAQTPTAPTSANGLANKAYVDGAIQTAQPNLTPYAPKASPVFSGNPTAPTPTTGDNSQSLATTAYVQAEIAANPAGFATTSSVTGAGYLTAANFGGSHLSASANGYRTDPGGVIEQWGYVTSPVGSNGSEDEMSIVTFPMQFPNGVWNIQITPKLSAPSGDADIWGQVLTPDAGGFTIYYQGSSSGTVAGMYWRAIGN